MPRLAALLFVAGVALAALPRRRALAPTVLPVVLEGEAAEHLALLLCDCPACMPSWSIH